MVEPQHLITHEYAHVIQAALHNDHNYQQFLRDKFAIVRRDPGRSVTGYGISVADEWWAETFAAMHLGGIDQQRNSLVRDMRFFFSELDR